MTEWMTMPVPDSWPTTRCDTCGKVAIRATDRRGNTVWCDRNPVPIDSGKAEWRLSDNGVGRPTARKVKSPGDLFGAKAGWVTHRCPVNRRRRG